MHGKERSQSARRGFTLILAMIIVAILLAVALTILGHAIVTAASNRSFDAKSDQFNAAEAGVSAALQSVELNPTPGTLASGGDEGCQTTQTLPGTSASFISCVGKNNKNGAGTDTENDPRPGGGTISIPAGDVWVYGHDVTPGGRGSWVEAIITRTADTSEPTGPLDATNCITDSYNPKATLNLGGLPNRMDANNCILINGQPASPIGGTGAGTTNQLSGSDGAPVGPQYNLGYPTAAQVTARQQNALLAAQGAPAPFNSEAGTFLTAGGTINIPGNAFIDACPGTPAIQVCPVGTGVISITQGTINLNNGGTIYIHGSISMSGQSTMNNNADSLVVVTNSYSNSGNAGYRLGAGQTLGEMIVIGTDTAATCAGGTAQIVGNGSNVGHIYVPFGNAQLAGNGFINGSVVAGVSGGASNIWLCGGGTSGGFSYNGTNNGQQPSPFWHIASYMEY